MTIYIVREHNKTNLQAFTSVKSICDLYPKYKSYTILYSIRTNKHFEDKDLRIDRVRVLRYNRKKNVKQAVKNTTSITEGNVLYL